MTVHRIDHINLRASGSSFAALRMFYCEVLGLEAGARPPLQSSGLWLYADEAPIVHLVEVAQPGPAAAQHLAQPVLDHVALRCSNLRQTLARLQRLGMAYVVNEVRAAGQVQVRLRDPAGLVLELLFPVSEAAEQGE
jgi:catechol 2,3-dioxygenase-like lactoylglutathione lyase family enzyme